MKHCCRLVQVSLGVSCALINIPVVMNKTRSRIFLIGRKEMTAMFNTACYHVFTELKLKYTHASWVFFKTNYNINKLCVLCDPLDVDLALLWNDSCKTVFTQCFSSLSCQCIWCSACTLLKVKTTSAWVKNTLNQLSDVWQNRNHTSCLP